MTITPLRRALKFVGCVATLALAACAIKPIGPKDTLKPDEGAFVFKVITDTTRGGDSLLFLIDTIEMQSEDGPNEPIFIAGTGQREATTPESMIFSGKLKPGRYKFVRGRHHAAPSNIFDPRGLFMNMGHLGSFNVRAGEVTQLGTLIFHPIGEVAPSRSFTGYTVANMGYGYVPPDAETLKSFEQYFPALTEQVKARASSGFNMTPDLNASAELARNYKKASRHINSMWQDEHGNFFAGKSMGKVLLKQAGRPGWRELDVGAWRGVHSVRPYRSGLIAGGEEGLLKFSPDGGNTWNDLVPPAWGQIAHIEVVRGNRVLVVVRRGATWTAFVTDDALVGAWRTFATLPLHTHTAFYPQPSPSFARRGNTLVIGGGLQDRVHILDLDSGSIESILNPVPMVYSISAQQNGFLVMRGGVLKYVALMSEDGGKTWRELKSRGFVAFKDSSNAYFVYDMHVAYSRDGGGKWTYHDNAAWKEGEVRWFQIDRSDQSLLVFLFDGSVHRSRDEGATWIKDR
jgi:photosystem II stability/assembly factor-like uncharacterized protein